ncbi:MAG: phage antirepressor N-terminal domain-containing protein [Enterobacteriaceae bacterium]
MNDLKNVAVINGKPIQVIEDNSTLYVPVRPICEILGVSVQTQLQKLKSDPLYEGSFVTLRVTKGAEIQRYPMTCITLKMVCMWIGSINANNVNEEAIINNYSINF